MLSKDINKDIIDYYEKVMKKFLNTMSMPCECSIFDDKNIDLIKFCRDIININMNGVNTVHSVQMFMNRVQEFERMFWLQNKEFIK